MIRLTSDHLSEISSPAELASIVSWVDDLNMIARANPQAPAVALVAQRRRCSVRTVYNKLKTLREQGPSAIGDRRTKRLAKAPTGHRSPAFLAWVASLYYQCARNNATPTVQQLMLTRLRAWRANPLDPDLRIPGYDRPPVDSAESRYRHPFGWSLRNLNAIKPDNYQRTDAAIGRLASKALMPPVLTTRVGVAVGEYYLFDDQFYDLMVHWGDTPVRPVGLNCLDLASACDVIRGIRPYLGHNEDGEKTLTRRDTLWLVVQLLTNIGFHKSGCTLVFESGTSRADAEFTKHLDLVTDGRVRVDIGDVSKDVIRGVLLPSKGNPRFKAARESWFNLLRNRMGSLPLALGMDRDHKPEDTDRVVAEERALLQIARTLPPDVAADLQFEGLPWSRFFPLANLISERINERTEHDIEGWAAAGRERVEYRLGEHWISEAEYTDLSPDTRALIIDRMRRGEIVSRLTKMSPRQVFDAGADTLVTISPYRWHHLIPPSYALPRTVPANRQLVIQSKDYGPAPIHFLPHYRTEDGDEIPLPAGADILIFLSPHHPDFALITRPDGRPYGLIFPVQIGTRGDREKLVAQWAARNKLRTQISPTAAPYNQSVADARTARREHNAVLLESAGASPKAVAKTRTGSAARTPGKRVKKPRPITAMTPSANSDDSEGLGIF